MVTAERHEAPARDMRRALVVDRSPLQRHGLAAILFDRGLVVAGQAASSADALSLLRTSSIDLLVVGVPADRTAADLVERARGISETLRALVLAPRLEPDDLRRLLSSGADAVLTLYADVDEIIDAVERVRAGERVVAPAHLSVLLGSLAASARVVNPLTTREMVVLTHLANGRSNRDIADAMIVSVATVKTHLSHIYDKLGVADRRQAVGRGVELGLLI